MKKRFVKILLSLILCLAILPIKNIEAKEAFDILTHDIEMNINEDGTIDVVETMSVRFDALRHGIYVNIPKQYTMSWEMEDGSYTYKNYSFPVTNVRVLSNHKSEKEDWTYNIRIIIGSADYYANKNETYKWSYTIHTRDLDLDGKQMVLMNILTDGWNTSTDSCTFKMVFPKSIKKDNVYTTTLANQVIHGIGETDDVVVNVTDNVVSGYTTRRAESYEKIVVQVLLDDNYFNFAAIDRPLVYLGFIAAVVAIIAFLVFNKYGRDEPIIQTVEFHAPKDISSAEVGVIIDETVNDRDVTSLFLDWGRRGIITIKEGSKSLILTKVRDLEPDAKKYEVKLFKSLFKGRDVVNTDDLKYTFYDKFNRAKSYLKDYFNAEHRTLSTKVSQRLQILFVFIASLLMSLYNGVLAYLPEYEAVIGIFVGLFSFIAVCIAINGFITLFNNRYMNSIIKTVLLALLCSALLLIPNAIMFANTIVNEFRLYLPIVVVAAEVITIFCTIFMTKKTPYGAELLGKVLGLREFIIVAEKDRLEQLVEENPYYFYDILPYAYALGLTSVWAEHFKDFTISPPDWYRSDRSYFDSRSFESSMVHSTHSMTSLPPSSSSSSSGGGFSGGGGSSGGFGGSSGGSW